MAVKREVVRTGWQEAAGILLLAISVLSFLSLVSYDPHDISLLHVPPNAPPANFIGPVGAWFAFLSFMGFGACGYLLSPALAYIGLLCIFKREGRISTKAIWMLVLLLGVASLMELNPGTWAALCAKLNAGSAGGVLGELIARRLLVNLLGAVGAGIISVTVLLVSMVMLFEIRPIRLAHYIGDHLVALFGRLKLWHRDRLDRRQQLEEEEREIAKRRRRLEEAMRATEPPAIKARAAEPVAEAIAPVEAKSAIDEELECKAQEVVEAVRTIRARREKKPAAPPPPAESVLPMGVPAGTSQYKLPGLDLLDVLPPARDREIKGDFDAMSQVLKDTLAEFGVEVDITNVERGPVVTRYELLPAAGVRVERIVGLGNNIALAMKAESVRVQAPIPGKGVVGIEVPNVKTTMVYLREIVETDEWRSGKAALPLALGHDVGGRVLIADLAEMPHMLVAGATGSGKTVCMNSILAGLLMARTPDQMRLMLIDPKIVEFNSYKDLPHLVVPVITEAKKVNLGLRWAINEMEKRYKLFARVGVRNIKAFNSRPLAKQEELFKDDVAPAEENEADKVPDRLPYLVIVVDELADLMLVAQADIENSIARLAQLSRAVGIHMILATQRPSVNVITGTIKANFPARISFQVAQKVDSRTILDAAGADKLLGRGDMLFLPPGSPKLIRAQGTFTSDAEIHRLVDFYKAQGQPQYEVAIKDKIEGKTADLPELEDDELLEAALEIIRQTRRASTSSLQRRLRIGYTRAARIMDLLEQKGIVGAAQGSDPREILIDLDGEVPQNVTKDGG